MAKVAIDAPNYDDPWTDGDGRLSLWARNFVRQVFNRVGAESDKVEDAHATAYAAAPQTTLVVAAGGLKTGGALSGNVGVTLYVAMTSVALLPTVGNTPGDWAFAVDGRKPGEGGGAGTGVPCFWSAGAWYSACSGAVVTS